VSKLEIIKLKKEEEKLWDEYVLRSDQSTFYHQLGWRNVVKETYGHKPIYLVAEEDSQIIGILPLFLIASKIFGTKLVSLPFSPYGGICANNKMVEKGLVEEAKKIAKEFDVDYLELRCLKKNNISNFNDRNLLINNSYSTFILELDRDPEVIWDTKFNNKVRNAIRKAYKSNLKFTNCGLKEFYKLYTGNMKHLGAPPHSYNFFENLMKEFPRDTIISGTVHDGITIASTFLLSFKDTLISGWTASDRKYSLFNPNNFLYWEVIKFACYNGHRYFDFGRSLINSGTFRFKKPWGANQIHLRYMYYLIKLKKVIDSSQANPSREKFSKVWRKLPIVVTNSLGPKLRKNFP